jgi:hypothetical protein
MQSYEKKGRGIYLFPDCSPVFRTNLMGIAFSDLPETCRLATKQSSGTDGRPTYSRSDNVPGTANHDSLGRDSKRNFEGFTILSLKWKYRINC